MTIENRRAEQLANKLLDFSKDYDHYEFTDYTNGYEDDVKETLKALDSLEGIESIINYLESFEEDEVVKAAKSLIDELETLKESYKQIEETEKQKVEKAILLKDVLQFFDKNQEVFICEEFPYDDEFYNRIHDTVKNILADEELNSAIYDRIEFDYDIDDNGNENKDITVIDIYVRDSNRCSFSY